MTPPTKLQHLPCFIGCKMLDFAPFDTAIDPRGFGGVMTPPYEYGALNYNLQQIALDL